MKALSFVLNFAAALFRCIFSIFSLLLDGVEKILLIATCGLAIIFPLCQEKPGMVVIVILALLSAYEAGERSAAEKDE